jgi:hypothetical protein
MKERLRGQGGRITGAAEYTAPQTMKKEPAVLNAGRGKV